MTDQPADATTQQPIDRATDVGGKARETLSLLGQDLIRQANGDRFNMFNPLAIQKAARNGAAAWEQSLDDGDPLKGVVSAGKNLLDLDVQVTQSAVYDLTQENYSQASEMLSITNGIKLPKVEIIDPPVEAEPLSPMGVARSMGRAIAIVTNVEATRGFVRTAVPK